MRSNTREHEAFGQRVQAMVTDADMARIDAWMLANRVRSRSDAIRRALEAGLDALDGATKLHHVQASQGPPADVVPLRFITINSLKGLVRHAGADAIMRALGKEGRAGQAAVSRYVNAKSPITLAQAARLRRAFPELDLNQAAEALLQIEEGRAAEEHVER